MMMFKSNFLSPLLTLFLIIIGVDVVLTESKIKSIIVKTAYCENCGMGDDGELKLTVSIHW